MKTKKAVVFTSMVVSGVWASITYVVAKRKYRKGFNDGAEVILGMCMIEKELEKEKKNSKKIWKRFN